MMSLEQVYYASQVVAAAAIIGSLIYLGLQTLQTSKNQRAMMHWSRMAHIREHGNKIADSTFAPIWRAGIAADPQMDLLAAHAFEQFARGQFGTFQELFWEHREGMIDRRRGAGDRRALKALLIFPGYRAAYRLNRMNFDPEFVALVDALIVEANKMRPLDRAIAWQKLAAEELAGTGAES